MFKKDGSPTFANRDLPVSFTSLILSTMCRVLLKKRLAKRRQAAAIIGAGKYKHNGYK